MNELAPGGRNMLDPKERKLLEDQAWWQAKRADKLKAMQPVADYWPTASDLPELPNSPEAFAKRHPRLSQIPGAQTVMGLFGGPDEAAAAVPMGGETVVAKSPVEAPVASTEGVNSRAGDMRDVLRTALHIRDDISPEAQTALDDFANSSEGRAISERLAAGDPGAVNAAKQGLIRMLRGQ
jgi:hypothetical protein